MNLATSWTAINAQQKRNYILVITLIELKETSKWKKISTNLRTILCT